MRPGLALAPVLLLLSNCRITDARVDEEIRRRGGVVVTAPGQIQLGPNNRLIVGRGTSDLFRQPQISIATGGSCQKYCWETVSREHLDGEPVLDPGRLEKDPGKARALSERAVNGYHPDLPRTSRPGPLPPPNPPATCDPSKFDQADYLDGPNFPDKDFDDNGVNNRSRVYVLEQETCVRCLVPPGPNLGCVRWYYVKVRLDSGKKVIKVVTTGNVDSPSADFTRAIDSWNR